MLRCKQCKYIYKYEIYHPWIISKSWYLDITFISLAWLHLLDFNVQCQTPHATFKGFTYACLLVRIASTRFSFFSRCAHALCGVNPTPHAKIPMMPNNILLVKHTNKGCLTCGICCVWAWSSYHFNSTFFFT